MASPDPTDVREELVRLLELQLRTLEKELFGGITEAEQIEYERRRAHIHQLYDKIFDEQTAA